MNSKILRRLEQLEKMTPSDLVVEYEKHDEVRRNTMIEFCRECRTDGVIYSFKIVDGSRMDDIDLLIQLIDEEAKGTL